MFNGFYHFIVGWLDRLSSGGRFFPLLLGAVTAAVIAGCGGGGGGGGGAAVAPNSRPVAAFSTTVSSGMVPLSVEFDGSRSSDADSTISSYHWDFGDGTTGSGVSPSHTYSSVGDYTVVLTVTDSSGATTTATTVISAQTTLIGTINIASGSVVDGDVNDPNALYTPNDTYTTAQPLPNPVTLGGYVNVAGAGPPGDSFTSGDDADFYSVSLVAGQTITVTISDPSVANDLDLHLYHDDGSVDPMAPDYSSTGTGQIESLTVPANGDYFIEVRVDSGASSYSLVIGQIAPQLISGRLVSTDEFVPGDVIVKFRDGTTGLSAIRSTAARAEALGLREKAGRDHRRSQLMTLKGVQRRPAAISGTARASRAGRSFNHRDPEKRLKFETMQMIKALRGRSDVLYAEPNYIYRVKATPVDNNYPFQWHYPLINLPTAWDVTTGATDVTVAVVDTGVLLNHPDLLGQFSADGGYDFIIDDMNSRDGEPGIDNNPNDPGDRGGVGSSSFHGTHVAGTVAAATSFAGSGVGVAGVAPDSKIMPLRVLGQLGGTSYDIMQAVRYAAGLTNDSGITLNASQRADVVNLSFGRIGGYLQSEQDLYTEVRNAGVIVVAAAGNDNSSALNYPAAYAGVISVAAVDMNRERAPYSSFGATVDVAAPGGDTTVDRNGDGYVDGVLSTLADDAGSTLAYNYTFYQGTSMAAPHMAGVIALMKSIYGDLAPQHVETLLQSGAIVEDIGATGRDDLFGHGLINAHKAVIEAQALASVTPVDNPLLGVFPAALNMGGSRTVAMLDATNIGNGTLSLSSVTDNAPWLTVTPESVDADQLGRYRVTVDRTSLADGTYQGTISFVSTQNSIDVPVLMEVVSVANSGNAGYHYAMLIDAFDFSLVDLWDGAAQSGRYNYQFNNVSFPAGREYFVVAGSDLNNDFYICDPGEACGAYFSLGDLSAIDADGPHSGLDFITGFEAAVQINVASQQETFTDRISRWPPTRRQLYIGNKRR